MKQAKTDAKKNAAEDLMDSLMEDLKNSISDEAPPAPEGEFILDSTNSEDTLLKLNDELTALSHVKDGIPGFTMMEGNTYQGTAISSSTGILELEPMDNGRPESLPPVEALSLTVNEDRFDLVAGIETSVAKAPSIENIQTPVAGAPPFEDIETSIAEAIVIEEISPEAEVVADEKNDFSAPPAPQIPMSQIDQNEKTVALQTPERTQGTNFGDKTVAVAGYSNRNEQNYEDKVKVSVGQSRGAFSPGYASWGTTDGQLVHADNLKIAQEKILELEKENEKLRLQNEELISASEIVKERADILTGQVHEFRNDRDALEASFKNEMNLLKSQLHRKDNELQKALMKVEELDVRLKFDMKKIRVRERELENRLELVRAEKNALVKSKDEQILDLRRKMDQLQLEVDSYRQKCIELNKVIDTNQESFKRTTRALRLAMANLELQEENKTPFKKVD